MKRILAVVLALLCLALSLPVLSADAIWEPVDNFYESHREDCRFLQKEFTVSEEMDGVKSPENDKPVKHLEAGEKVFILCVYTDGKGVQWGICEQYNEKKEGWDDFWLPMEKLTKVYDGDDFLADHFREMKDEPALPEMTHKIIEKMPLWNYPGAEEYDCYLDENYGEFDLTGYAGYTDELGNLWLNISYFEGLSGWVYVSDPESLTPHEITAATPTPAPTQTVTPTVKPTTKPTAEPTQEPLKGKEDYGARLRKLLIKLVVFSVALVVLVSVLLIVMIARRNRRR